MTEARRASASRDRPLAITVDRVLQRDPRAAGVLTAAVTTAADTDAVERQVLDVCESLGYDARIEREEPVEGLVVAPAKAP